MSKTSDWLEKQGQTFTKKDVDDAYLTGVYDAKQELEKQGEQKSDWSEEDERVRKELVTFLEELSKLGKNTNFDRWKTSDCANWIAWLEKQGEKKSSDEVLKIRRELYQSGYNDGYKHGIEDGKQAEQKPHTLWYPADGDYLPEIDRDVIVLTQKNPLEGNEYAVSFAHRPPVSWIGRNIITDEKETFYPKRYEKAGWNIPYVKWWLDCDLPTNKQEHENEG